MITEREDKLPTAEDGPGTGRPADARTGARVAFALALAVLAGTLVIAARSEPPPDTNRLDRRVELMELIAAEQARTAALAAEADTLAGQVADYEKSMQAGELGDLQGEVDDIAAHAGLTAVRGPGVSVILNDSVRVSTPDEDPNNYLIHEQDLQAVINALWAGEAEAVAVNGQRVLATTAIRCVGNTLLLHGQVYMPPYDIAAIGDVETLAAALERDPVTQRLRAAAEQYELGFEVAAQETIEVGAFEGLSPMQVARPAGTDLG